MAIQPPVIHTGYDIPPQPQDPPSSQDVVNAGIYAHRVELAFGKDVVPSIPVVPNQSSSAMGGTAAPSVDAVAEAHKFHHSVTAAKAAEAAAPPWFHTAMRELTDRLDRIEGRVGRIEDRLIATEDRLIATEIIAKIAENARRGEGKYVAVPNARGEYPVSQGLPALTHVDQIRALSTADVDRYVAFYSSPGQPAPSRSIDGKKHFIANEIGCIARLL
ncbi:hypothetical protein GLOTRDRAFT_132281 [Gloeophyllum trabeum ATCC 11539]|uniref:Mug135-like C-terminal domain-containing protein n=1 Tax=Gloeophyllum trabeum (strain ATCC 11539 / FP-39264 / Madison 617) TaxID=670483 RepID=S7PXU9_GLOTA|nr:uncharacterized protein GLOTRDRAFT_132281 [Gloeophyllum trabeum ATCC 11539]EPQ52162.1 hypothetical protein GLOTRDRAFT_132281 [Gloeophyllum trabeum ATCC 11539]